MICKICQKYHKEGHPLERLKKKQRDSAKRTNKMYKNRSEAAKKAWETKRKSHLSTLRSIDKE